MYAELVPIQVKSKEDYGVNDSSNLIRYQGIMWVLSYWSFRYWLPKGRKEAILAGWLTGREEWYPRAYYEVALVLHKVHSVEAPKDQVMVHILPGVLYGDILEHTLVCPKGLIYC